MSNKARKTGNRLVLLRGESVGMMEGWDEQPPDSVSVFITVDAAPIEDVMIAIDAIIERHQLETRETRFLDGGVELRFRRRQDAVTFRAAVRALPSISVPES